MKNFEIQHKLGSGSYGVIYKALNKSNRSICVLKQINLTRLNEKAKKNAVNQATVMGKLNHPFIVRYQDSFIQDRTLNIVMEYCDGGDLAYYLKQQNKKYIKEQKIWKFFLQICLGLQHIHKNKILHRDIKTLNIFLNKNDQVKIGDLGVAKILSNNDFAQTMVGTPFYLSPELCQQKPYNQKSDVWAVGCLLYELCTFRHPFEAANQASLILKIIRGKYLPIPEFYSKDLKDMIDSCLQRDYKRRPTTSMILNKPRIKEMIEQFKFKELIECQNKKNTMNLPQQIPVKKEKEVKSIQKKAQPKIQKVKEQVKPKPLQKQQIQKNNKAEKIQIPKSKIIEKQREQKKIQRAFQQYIPQQRKVKQIEVKQHKPKQQKKVLFGDKMQNKAQFINKLEQKIQDNPPPLTGQRKSEKKSPPPPTYFQIPWKEKDKNIPFNKKQENFYQKQKQKSKKNSIDVPSDDKVVVHSQRVSLISQTPFIKKPDIVHKVKTQKEVQPRVYQSQKNIKPKGIIKSGGFSQEAQLKNPLQERKKSQIISKTEDKKVQVNKNQSKNFEKGLMDRQVQKYQPKSEKNIKNEFSEKPSVLGKKRQSNAGVPHYPPRVRRNPKQEIQKTQYKKIPNKIKTSQSRYSNITKQEQDLVANLPDIVKKGDRQSDSDDEQNFDMNKKFKLNKINDQMVLKKYEQIQDKTETNEPSYQQCYEQSYDKKQLFGEQEIVQQQIQNQSVKIQIQQQQLPNQQLQLQNESIYNDQTQETKINYDEQEVYEINNFDMEGNYQQRRIQQNKDNQWQYDEQPQLPTLQQSQAPFFEQANPYLVDQKVQEQTVQDKKQYLQIKLKQNMKRQDQINRLMQIKIQQCRSMVSKGFQDILQFFRTKINMKQQYTDQDQRQVQNFLRKRNLTDHRKFQNIYKIMHFQMQLQNTRKIIQTICKKLNDLEN